MPTGSSSGSQERRLRPLRELGRVSYFVYLIHVAVAYVVFNLITHTTPYLEDLKSFGIMLLCAAITYLAAKLSWIFLEGPLVQIGHQTKYAAVPHEALSLEQVRMTSGSKPDHA